MKEDPKYDGIQLVFSTEERGIWWDSDRSGQGRRKAGFGIVIKFRWGRILRPIGKIWKKGFWTGDPKYNPWTGEYWFVMRFPFAGPWISVALWPLGIYFGLKEYGCNKDTHQKYSKWMRPEEFGQEGVEALYLCPSFSIRRTRWK